MFIIYKTTNIINNKIYIGQHKICNESTLDPSYIGCGVSLCNSIVKYGKQSFQRDILHIINSSNQKVVDKLEEYYIKMYDSTNRKIGYNILKGTANKFGSGSPSQIPEVAKKISLSRKGKHAGESHHMFGKHWSEDAKKQNSQSNIGKQAGIKHWNYGKHRDDKFKKTLSEKQKGNKYWLGKTHTEETKKRLSEHFKGKPWKEESKLKMSKSISGNKNPMWGKIRITNEIENKIIDKDSEIPDGWRKGMKNYKKI